MDAHNFAPQMGMDVIGSDGEKVGEIDAVEQDYFVVRKGFFFPSDHYVPFSAVDSYDDNAVYLNVTKDGALNESWGEPPVSTGGSFGETRVDDASYGETTFGDDSYTAVTDVDRNVGSYDAGLDRGTGSYVDDDTTIEVREETLGATTREVDRGAVRVDKNVIEEQQTLEVPVTEEEVHIERRAVDRPADNIDFQETTFEVPLRGEEVEVTRDTRVVEEIDIDKSSRERLETVTDTVRREEVDIESDVMDVGRDGTRVGNRGSRTESVDGDDSGLLDDARNVLDPRDDDRHNR